MKFIVKTVARGAIAVGAALGAAGGFAQSGPLTGEYKAWDPVKALQDAQQRIAEGKDPIPGPRTCFWARGPAAADPYINIAYPDSATYYWAAVFTMPPGAKLHLEGQFPKSRYISFISYDGAGVPIESVADYLLKPNVSVVNPYLPGADRSSAQRGYRLVRISAIVDACFRLIVDGVSAPSWTRVGCAQARCSM